MNVIEVKNPNFHVVVDNLNIHLSDGRVIQFNKDDGIAIIDNNNKACVEFTLNDAPYSVELTSEQLQTTLTHLVHTQEYKVDTLNLLDALVSENVSTDSLVSVFSENSSSKNVSVTTRVMSLSVSEKVSRILDYKSVFDQIPNRLICNQVDVSSDSND